MSKRGTDAAFADAIGVLAEAHEALTARVDALEGEKRQKTAVIDPWSIEAIAAPAALFTVQQQLDLNQLARQHLFDVPDTAPLKQLLAADDKLIDWPNKRVVSWNTPRALELAHALYYAQNTELICEARESKALACRAEAQRKEYERLCFTAAKERDAFEAQLKARADVQLELREATAEIEVLLKRMQTARQDALQEAGVSMGVLIRGVKNHLTAKAKAANVPGNVIHELVQELLSLITHTKCIHNGIAVADAHEPRHLAE